MTHQPEGTHDVGKRTLTITSSAGNWIESGTTTRLTVTGSSGRLMWAETSFGSITPVPSESGLEVSADFVGTGFGQVNLIVTDDGNLPCVPGTLTLWVGSVVISGADGNFWLLKAGQPMSITPLDPRNLDPAVHTLIDSNAVLADLTDQSTATAVTCYLLNLASFVPKAPKSPRSSQ